jgi:pyruvate dehydrogenase E1 component alpha subunit
LAVGAALTTAMKKIDRIVVCFFGDGAANEGSFHEALNLASIWKLPVLFVCENNQYGMSMSKKRSMNIDDIAVRASSYGIPGETIDGNDVLKVYEKMKQAREYVRDNGPMLLVCNTYRYLGHSKSDANVYRTKEEINEWKEKDPIKRLKEYLVSGKVMTQKEIDALETETTQIIEDAVTFAENSTYPSLDTIMDDVYA